MSLHLPKGSTIESLLNKCITQKTSVLIILTNQFPEYNRELVKDIPNLSILE